MMKKADRPETGPGCGRCGQTNRPERSFCRKCGCWLKPVAITRKAQERADRDGNGACSACGEISDASAPSCPRCGALFPAAAVAQGGSSPRRRRSAPKPISEKRAARVPLRRDVVAAVRARDRVCQADAVHALIRDLPCGGRLDAHEIIPRSAWAAGYLVETNVVLVCEHAHRWIDHHPNGAHALGLHGYSWERPDYQAALG